MKIALWILLLSLQNSAAWAQSATSPEAADSAAAQGAGEALGQLLLRADAQWLEQERRLRSPAPAPAEALRLSPSMPMGRAEPEIGERLKDLFQTGALPKSDVRGGPVRDASLGNAVTLAVVPAARAVDVSPASPSQDGADGKANVELPGPPSALRPQPSFTAMTAMLARGRSLFEAGDIAGARLLFTRAATAQSPDAFTALARTYDPDVLRRMRVRGVKPDKAVADALYAEAASAARAAR